MLKMVKGFLHCENAIRKTLDDLSAIQFEKRFLQNLSEIRSDADFVKKLDEDLLEKHFSKMDKAKSLLYFPESVTIKEVYEEIQRAEEFIKFKSYKFIFGKRGGNYDKLSKAYLDAKNLVDLVQAKIVPTKLTLVYADLSNAIISLSKELDIKRQNTKRQVLFDVDKDIRTDEKLIAMAFTKVLETDNSVALVTEDFNHFPAILKASYRTLTSKKFGQKNNLLREKLKKQNIRLYIRQKDESYCLLTSTDSINIDEKEVAFLDNSLYAQMRCNLEDYLNKVNSYFLS